MSRLFFFFLLLFGFCFSKSYQIKVVNSQKGDTFFLVISGLDDLVLESKEDSYFYDVINNKKEISLEKGKEYFYTFSTKESSADGFFTTSDESTIFIDANLLSGIKSKKNLREISKVKAKKR